MAHHTGRRARRSRTHHTTPSSARIQITGKYPSPVLPNTSRTNTPSVLPFLVATSEKIEPPVARAARNGPMPCI